MAQRALDAIGEGTAARHLDHAALVERWAAVVGADAVTCIVLDPEHPEILPRAMERLLGLPGGLLDPPANGAQANRALTAAELELVGAVAHELREAGLTRAAYMELVGRGTIPRLLERRPGPDEARIRLGEAAAARAREIDRAAAGRVRESRVRVIGDLDRHAGGWPGRGAGRGAARGVRPGARRGRRGRAARCRGTAEDGSRQPVPTAAVRGARSGLADRLRRRAARIIARVPSHAGR